MVMTIKIPRWVEETMPDYATEPPEDSMCLKDLMDAWGLGSTSTREKMKGLLETGKYKYVNVKVGAQTTKYYVSIHAPVKDATTMTSKMRFG